MARQTNHYFIGRKDNVVGSTWKGIPYLRYQPDRVKQSAATKKSNDNMGKASKVGAGFRKVFAPLLPQPKDKMIRDLFTGAIKKWLQTKPSEQRLPSNYVPFINGFEFNESSKIVDRLKLRVTLKANSQQQLVVHIPAFIPREGIAAPAFTKLVNMHIAAASYSIPAMELTGEYVTAKAITYNNTLIAKQSIQLPLSGSVILVLAALQYITVKKGIETVVTDIRWLPCGVVGGYAG